MSKSYLFCYNPDKPGSLAILQPLQKVKCLMLQDLTITIFVWVMAQEDQNIKDSVKNKIRTHIIFKKNINQVKKCLEQQDFKSYQLIIICPQEDKETADSMLGEYEKIKHVIYFPATSKDIRIQIKSVHNSAKQSIFLDKYQQFQAALVEYDKRYQYRKLIHRQLPNFVDCSEVDILGKLTTAIKAMIFYPYQKVTRTLILDEFRKLKNLVKYVMNSATHELQYSDEPNYFEQLLEELSTQMQPSKAFKWYCKQSFLHKMLNNLLRSCNNLAQVFLIQPFHKDLFRATFDQFKKLLLSKQLSPFTCYRGGFISTSQLTKLKKSIGFPVYNRIHMSTSLLKQKALDFFAINVVYQIMVDPEKLKKVVSTGFAYISQYSEYKQEKEVLFNPLNKFIIIQIIQSTTKDYCYIRLQHIGFDQKASNCFSMKQISINRSIKSMIQNLDRSQEVQCYLENLRFKGEIQFWLKYYELVEAKIIQDKNKKGSENYFQKSSIARKLGYLYFELGKLIQSLDFYLISQKLQRKYCCSRSRIQMSGCLNNIGLILFELKQEKKSIKYLEKALRLSSIMGVYSDLSIMILQNMANHWSRMLQYEKSKKFYEKSLQISKKIYTENHPQTGRIIHNLANLYESQNNFIQALKLYHEALKIFQLTNEKTHPDYYACVYQLIATYIKAGQFQIALQLLKRQMDLVKSLTGQMSLTYFQVVQEFSCVYFIEKQIDTALRLFQTYLNIKVNKIQPANSAIQKAIIDKYIEMDQKKGQVKIKKKEELSEMLILLLQQRSTSNLPIYQVILKKLFNKNYEAFNLFREN